MPNIFEMIFILCRLVWTMLTYLIIFVVVVVVLRFCFSKKIIQEKSPSFFKMEEKTFDPMSQSPPGGVYGVAECEFVVHEGEEEPLATRISQMAANYNLEKIGIRAVREGWQCRVWITAVGEDAQAFVDDAKQEGVLL